jgi:DNA repair protein RecN (Recombination protein N)
LRATASRLAHADDLRLAARTAHDALLGDADDPASYASDVATLLGIARRSLDMEAADDPALGAMRDRMIELAALVADLGADLVQYGALLDADPARLAEVEDRRALLTRLTRKYGPELTDVLAWAGGGGKAARRPGRLRRGLGRARAERDALAAETAKRAVRCRPRGTTPPIDWQAR